MAKLDIDFVLLDESVVMYGFRSLMSGAKLSGFQKNPVMLFMHNRAQAGVLDAPDNDVMLPIGKWYDIRIIDNKLLAKPDFDDSDEFALKIQEKVKGGYLNAASICLEPITVSDDAKLKLKGQPGPTVTEWGLLEGSIVDIPNCRNALAIRNSAGAKITLTGTDQNNDVLILLKNLTKNETMDKKLLCAQLGLPETATEAEITAKLSAIKTGNETSVTLASENSNLKTENTALKAAAVTGKIETLVDGAIAGKKLHVGDREKYLKLAKADFDTTKEVIDEMNPYESIESKLAGAITEVDKERLSELSKMSAVDLYHKGLLDELKKLSLPVFKTKYKEAFDLEYKD